MPDEQTPKAAESLPSQVHQHLETAVALQAQHEREGSQHQRAIVTITFFLGRPLFLALIFTVVAAWTLLNLFPSAFGLSPWDAPPFFWLQGMIGFGALLLTVIVLIKQNRQERLAERRAQLDLQVNLLAEQKIAKLIALVEELRRDLPAVRNRADPEAEEMSHSADAGAVLDALEEKLEEATHLVDEVQEARSAP